MESITTNKMLHQTRLKISILALFIFAFAAIGLEAQTNSPDSADGLEADSAGLSLLPSDQFPASGTFWVVTSPICASDHFKTYCRFRPSGDGNIYVTLGRVDWDWNATVDYTGLNPLSLSSWTITSSAIHGPTFVPTNEFPQWDCTQ